MVAALAIEQREALGMLFLHGRRIIPYERVTMLARAAGEFPIMLWLLIKGADAHQLWPPLAGEVRDAASS